MEYEFHAYEATVPLVDKKGNTRGRIDERSLVRLAEGNYDTIETSYGGTMKWEKLYTTNKGDRFFLFHKLGLIGEPTYAVELSKKEAKKKYIKLSSPDVPDFDEILRDYFGVKSSKIKG